MDHSALTNMRRHTALAGLLYAAVLTSCGKDAVQSITEPAPASRIKFFNFGVNAPGVNFYANDTKMTAITSASGTESTTGTGYGGVGSGGFYSGIAPGQYTVAAKIAAATDKDLAISTIPVTIADGKFYSAYVSGFYNAAGKSVEGFVVEDPLPAVDNSVAYVRFVNAISNSSPMALFAKNTVTAAEVAVGAAVAYKAAGAFTPLPEAFYDLNTRLTGSAANAISRTGVSFLAGRIYTISARGDMTVVSSTATNRPFLDNNANR
jgi:hypothetical protein